MSQLQSYVGHVVQLLNVIVKQAGLNVKLVQENVLNVYSIQNVLVYILKGLDVRVMEIVISVPKLGARHKIHYFTVSHQELVKIARIIAIVLM